LSGWLVLWGNTAFAQRALDIERFTPALDDRGFLSLQGPRTPGSALWNLGLFLSYSYRPLDVTPDDLDQPVKLVEHRMTGDLLGQVGLGGRGAAALSLPLVFGQVGDRAFGDDRSLPVATVGDPKIAARYRLIGDDADQQLEHRDGPGLALQAGASLPLGHRQAFAGEGALRSQLQLIGDFQLLGAGVGATVGWLHRFRPRDFYQWRFRDELNFGAAFKMPIPWFPKVAGVLEARGVTDAGAPFAKNITTPVELALGARFGWSDWAFAAAIGAGLNRAVGAPAIRGTLGVWWAPRVHDADRDGIGDDKDQCAMLPEDFDGFEDKDGCPDLDNDNDGIPDLDDLCPNQAAEEGRDQNEDGCTDR
jgi:hypothetical protein